MDLLWFAPRKLADVADRVQKNVGKRLTCEKEVLSLPSSGLLTVNPVNPVAALSREPNFIRAGESVGGCVVLGAGCYSSLYIVLAIGMVRYTSYGEHEDVRSNGRPRRWCWPVRLY